MTARAYPRSVRRLLRRNPVLRRAQTMARMQRSRNPFLVIAPPKTGSTTIELLAKASTGRPFVKMHSVSTNGLAWQRRIRGEAGLRVDIPELQDADYIHALFGRDPGRRWDVITTLREPVGRSISGFFHVGRAWRGYDPEVDPALADIDEMVERLVEWPLHPVSCHWVRWELGALTGIDFHDRPFDFDTGFQIHENDRFRVLVVRAEDLDRVGATAIQTFFGTKEPVPETTRMNDASTKGYATLYDRFRSEARLPGWFVDALQSTEQSTHYYRPDELRAVRERWVAPSPVGVTTS